MKKLLKVLLPPFIGFCLYFIAIRYSSHYFNLNIGQIGTGSLDGFMAYYRYALPLLFIVAILTQLLIVVPIWNKVLTKSASARFWAIFSFVFVCFMMAGALSYPIWDKVTSVHHLLKVFLFMSAVQLIYWLINFVALIIIE
ncbi:hypothetical protein [uncultured Mucilaginibacter sp.]|uniref:hypothetical protein n=1 Tax=uncultured Mucilaginibacter sp. TaxID=797541 RepID=UPI0025FBB7FC|nr:hypothetical protein [uncultured Mucilaginibacter sp.]